MPHHLHHMFLCINQLPGIVLARGSMVVNVLHHFMLWESHLLGVATCVVGEDQVCKSVCQKGTFITHEKGN